MVAVKFWTATIFLHAHLQVVYYKCVQFHKNPISGLGGVALTRYMDGRANRTGSFCINGRQFTANRTGSFCINGRTVNNTQFT
jgi:hypothetical protein